MQRDRSPSLGVEGMTGAAELATAKAALLFHHPLNRDNRQSNDSESCSLK